jgi:VanZ family protein
VGLLFALAYPRRRLQLALAGIVATGALAILQLWAPGRHAYVRDFVLNAGVVCVGVIVATLLQSIRRPRAS